MASSFGQDNMNRVNSIPLGFGASWIAGSQRFDVDLLFGNQIVSKVQTPILDSDSYSNLWWRDDMSEMGVSLMDESVRWIPSQIVGYAIEVSQPSRFEGSCGFGVIAEELPEMMRLDRFLCIKTAYSIPCLLALMSLSSKLSEVSPKPVRMITFCEH